MTLLTRFQLSDLAVVFILMFFGIAGAIPGVAPNQAMEMTGTASSLLQTLVGILSQVLVDGFMAGWLLLDRAFWKEILAPERRSLLIFPMTLAVIAVASLLWSDDPVITARRAIPFATAALFGVLLAVRYQQAKFLFLLQMAFALLALWSAVLALGFPSIGLDASTGHAGNWQGAFSQKNACGRAMVFAIASVLSVGRTSVRSVVLLALFGVELLLSGSRGAWLLAAILAAALTLVAISCRFDRTSRTVLLALLAMGALVFAALGAAELAELAPLLGRDATLTGRTAIWHQVWLSILHRPVLGYGFAAFWLGLKPPSWDVVVALRFVLFHAHNGLLEIWLELGALGLLLFLAGFLRAAWLLWPEIAAGRFKEAAWPFAVLVLVALYDLDENTLLSFNGLFWLLYVTCLTRIEQLALARRSRSIRRASQPPQAVPFLLPGAALGGGRAPWL